MHEATSPAVCACLPSSTDGYLPLDQRRRSALPPALLAIGNLACRLSGSVVPFDQATLDALYPNPASYLVKVRQSVDALQRQGLLLPEDAEAVMNEAARLSTGR